MNVSVVVPVLDEERVIARQLGSLAATPGIAEVVVVDGGSRDRTAEIARSFSGVRADVFRRVGGFPDQRLLEDLDLCLRLRRLGRIRTVPAEVRVGGGRAYSGIVHGRVPAARAVTAGIVLTRIAVPPTLFPVVHRSGVLVA